MSAAISERFDSTSHANRGDGEYRCFPKTAGVHALFVSITGWGVLYMAWVRDQVYVFAYKGNTSAVCLGRGGTREGKGGWKQRRIPSPFRRLCSTLSDMLTDRRSDARTNLFSIRPMHFKLIVPRSRYPVVILCLVLLKHKDGTIVVVGRGRKVCDRFRFFSGHL